MHFFKIFLYNQHYYIISPSPDITPVSFIAIGRYCIHLCPQYNVHFKVTPGQIIFEIITSGRYFGKIQYMRINALQYLATRVY